MKRFRKDFKQYYNYSVFASKSVLKSEVANSHLSWMWWILDPLLFMLVYVFIALIVFKKGEPYFPVYVFIGLTIWNFFNKTVTGSVKAVRSNVSVISKVYIPKYMLIFQKVLVNGFKMLLSFLIIAIMMVFFRVPLSWTYILAIPIVIVLLIVTFGFSVLVAHFGVYIEDLSNVLTVVLKLVFYMSGVFYNIEGRVPEPYNHFLMKVNPTAFLMSQMRHVLLYGDSLDYKTMAAWLVIGVLLCVVGIKTIYKYENSYVKVI